MHNARPLAAIHNEHGTLIPMTLNIGLQVLRCHLGRQANITQYTDSLLVGGSSLAVHMHRKLA